MRPKNLSPPRSLVFSRGSFPPPPTQDWLFPVILLALWVSLLTPPLRARATSLHGRAQLLHRVPGLEIQVFILVSTLLTEPSLQVHMYNCFKKKIHYFNSEVAGSSILVICHQK